MEWKCFRLASIFMGSLAARQMVGLPNIKIGRRGEEGRVQFIFLEQPAIMKKRFLSVSLFIRWRTRNGQVAREGHIIHSHRIKFLACHIVYFHFAKVLIVPFLCGVLLFETQILFQSLLQYQLWSSTSLPFAQLAERNGHKEVISQRVELTT